MKIKLRQSFLVAIVTFATANIGYANGMLPPAMGVKTAATGGAGIAYPREANDANYNPALVGFIDTEIALSLVVLHNPEKFDTTGAHLTAGTPLPPYMAPLENRAANYVAGGYEAINYRLNPNLTIGLAVTGGGAKIKYDSSLISPALSSPSEFSATAVLLSPNIAWRVSERQGYGVSLIVGGLMLKADVTTPQAQLSNGANETHTAPGIGARIGGLWGLTSDLYLGASVSTPIYFQRLHAYEDAVPYALNLPPVIGAGLAWHVSPSTHLLLDVEETLWKSMRATGRMPEEGGFGWKNVFSVKTGVEQEVTPRLRVNAGYNYANTPIRSNQVLVNAFPSFNAVPEHILTAGINYDLSKHVDIDINVAHYFPKTLEADGTGFGGAVTRGLQLKSGTELMIIGLRWKC